MFGYAKRLCLNGICCALLCLSLAPAAYGVEIALVDTDVAGFVGMAQKGELDTPTLVTSYAEFTSIFGGVDLTLDNPYLAPSAAAFFDNGGQKLYVVRVADNSDAAYIGHITLRPASVTGLQALRAVDAVGLVAIPGVTSLAVQTAMIAHCEDLGDRMAILDPASTDSIGVVEGQRALLSSDDGYAALYYPWIVGAPTGVGRSLTLPPSGYVAGRIAGAPPNEDPVGSPPLVSATGMSHEFSQLEAEALDGQNINPIRWLTGGVQLWGAHTLYTNQDWEDISVRRRGLLIEDSITEGTTWARTEPNDGTLWTQLQSDMEAFLYQRYLDGWFVGATASESYDAEVGLGSTMTAQDVEEGRVIMEVCMTLLHPEDFIYLQIIQQQTSDPPANTNCAPQYLLLLP